MLLSHNGVPVDPHVELVELGDRSWRVTDDRIPEGDARRVLGFLQRTDHGVEMMWMRPRPDCEDFTCLAEALAAASIRMRLEGEAIR